MLLQADDDHEGVEQIVGDYGGDTIRMNTSCISCILRRRGRVTVYDAKPQ